MTTVLVFQMAPEVFNDNFRSFEVLCVATQEAFPWKNVSVYYKYSLVLFDLSDNQRQLTYSFPTIQTIFEK